MGRGDLAEKARYTMKNYAGFVWKQVQYVPML